MPATAHRFAQFHATYTGAPSLAGFRPRKPLRANPTRDIVMIGLLSGLLMLASFLVLAERDMISVQRFGAAAAPVVAAGPLAE